MEESDMLNTVTYAVEKMKDICNDLKELKPIPKEVIEQYRFCLHSLKKLNEFSICLIENCNKCQQVVVKYSIE